MKKIYFGWWVLTGLFLIYLVSNGIGLNTLPLFNKSLINEFKWDPEEVTRPAGLLFFLIAILSPFVGILFNRYSAKLLMSIGSFGLLFCLIAFSQIQNYTQFTLIYLLYGVALLLAGIIPSIYLLTIWFYKYRGIAIGIFLMASSFGGAVFNPVAGYLIKEFGWRNAALWLAAFSSIFLLVPVFLLVRNKPSELGLFPDGADAEPQYRFSSSQEGVTFVQAVTSLQFYLILFVTASMWFCITGIIRHQTIFFNQDLKIDTIIAGQVTGLFFLFSILGKVLFGYLSDQFNKKLIMLLATVNLAVGSTLLLLISNEQSYVMYLYAVVYGIGFSGAFTMIQVVVAEVYQGKSYGSILGMVTGVDTFAGSMGIILLGIIRKGQESYYPAFYLMFGLCLIACLCVNFIKIPVKVKSV